MQIRTNRDPVEYQQPVPVARAEIDPQALLDSSPATLFAPCRRSLRGQNWLLALATGTVLPHSCRSATIGLVFAARRAGSQQATIATVPSSATTAIMVSGSLLLMP